MTRFIFWTYKCQICNSDFLLIFLVVISQLTCSSVALETPSFNSSSNSSFRSKPVLQIRPNQSGNFDVDKDDKLPLVFTENIDKILIKCSGSYPIEWKWSSQMPQKWADYSIKTVSNHTTNFYQLEIHLTPKNEDEDEDVDGLFGYLGSCQNILNKNSCPCASASENPEEGENSLLATRLDIFAPGKNSKANYFIGAGRKFKILNRNQIKIPANFGFGLGFLIPCPLKMKAEPKGVNLTLYQIFNGTEDKQISESKYDPKAGFYVSGLDLESEKLNGTFQCRAESTKAKSGEAGENVTFEFVQTLNQNQGEDWFNIVDPRARKVGEKVTKVFYINKIEQEIICSTDDFPNANADPNANVKVTPKFKWTRISDDGPEEEIGTHLGFSITFSPDKTILEFLRITQELQGTYFCQATWTSNTKTTSTSISMFQTASRAIYIQVKNWRIGVAGYVMISISALVSLLTIIVCLCKCRKTEEKIKQIEKLSSGGQIMSTNL